MKYFLLLFLFLSSCLTWCHQQQSQPYWTGNMTNTWINHDSIFNYPHTTWWKLSEYFTITWLYTTITFSWHTLTYNGIFSFQIPHNLGTRSYENFVPNNLINENLVFWEETHSNYVSVFLGDNNFSNISMTDKKSCLLQTAYNETTNISRNTVTKQLDNKDIFITKVTVTTPWNIHPSTYITHLCFIDNTLLYDIVMDNYNFSDAQEIIDSFYFID